MRNERCSPTNSALILQVAGEVGGRARNAPAGVLGFSWLTPGTRHSGGLRTMRQLGSAQESQVWDPGSLNVNGPLSCQRIGVKGLFVSSLPVITLVGR